MMEQIVGSKKYTLRKIEYRLVDLAESLYLEVGVVQDIEFGTREYTYGMNFNAEEIAFFMTQVAGMTEYVMTKLIENDA